ncbi:uncharacterized protein E0L32_010367 [Thyridium curvatum]|uniref:Uncharacterized protein n=1 Tax=Thyridium curvatum TaxID=1093900 RepID=A0A507AGH8_9PEZI|nr:uncharacterized protein E0L32_010367 [Thyridium curvatum]TPX07912.1 hypothetical protein E0L32_010367 [Thyridium curvatum]
MEPLTVIGALASAAQLFDMSLKYSYRAGNFVSALKHSEEHAALLHQRPYQHLPVHSSIIEISRQFADDMLSLHELLPYDLTKFSTSLRKRTRFVLRTKDTEKVLQRLDSRKSAATLALEVTGRLNEVRLQHNIVSLQSQMQLLSSQQDGLLEKNVENRDELLAQFHSHETHVVASIRALSEILARNGWGSRSPSGVCWRRGLRISEVQTQVAVILAQQNDILSSQRLLVAKANAEANDPDILARPIRIELRQQLEPLLEKIDGAREHIDRVATAFSSEAVSKLVFETEGSPSAANRTEGLHVDVRSSATPPSEAVVEAMCSTLPANGPPCLQPRIIRLSSIEHYISSRFGTLSIRMKTYRLSKYGIGGQRTYFQLRADILPRPQLCSRALSALYSSGPDHHGYFSICPSISIMNILSDDSEVLLKKNDPARFRQLIETGYLGIWDVSELGYNLLQLSLSWNLPMTCQYLLRDSGYGAQLAEQDEITIITASSILTPVILRAEPDTAVDILDHLKHFTSNITDETNMDSYLSLGWNNFYADLLKMHARRQSCQEVWHTAVSSARRLIESGHTLRPFCWTGLDHLGQTTCLIDLYLETGGDPNEPAPSGDHPFLFALKLVLHSNIKDEIKDSQTQHSGELNDDDTEAEDNYSNCVSDRDLCVKLCSGCHKCFAMSLTDVAFEVDIGGIWAEALEQCGLDPSAVLEESDRRLAKHRKLNGASRTGVDVDTVVGEHEAPGLRRRNISRVREILEA